MLKFLIEEADVDVAAVATNGKSVVHFAFKVGDSDVQDYIIVKHNQGNVSSSFTLHELSGPWCWLPDIQIVVSSGT